VIDLDKRTELRRIAAELGRLDYKARYWRGKRDAIILRLVADGVTWREVADAAGIAHPYIAQLKKRAKARTAPVLLDVPANKDTDE
jgi:hypothetical protein